MTSSDRAKAVQYIVTSGRPHNPHIGHLTETHSLPATASRLLSGFLAGDPPAELTETLSALCRFRDDDPESSTYRCFKWYVEDPAINDTNASFFICTPLVGIWLQFCDQLSAGELSALKEVFRSVLPWFVKMSQKPSLFYPNKCISDAGMLLAAGHILDDEETIVQGRKFCERFFEYCDRRGMGWGEDHSPVYTKVICDVTLLIMALETSGSLFDAARMATDMIVDWACFHDGTDAVPSIRGYNFEAKTRVSYAVSVLTGAISDAPPKNMIELLRKVTGYTFTPPPRPVPRQRRWRTFDEHFSTSFIASTARLGTLSEYPLMPNTYMHDGWGLGWQTKPCAFIVGEQEYGILEWATEDFDGTQRQHQAAGSIHDWASRYLFRREGFHPDVITVCHQEKGAAIILREIHYLHSPTRCLSDRWRLCPGKATLWSGGSEIVAGEPIQGKGWLILEYGGAVVALKPLTCRVVSGLDEDPNPQRHFVPELREPEIKVTHTDNGTYVSLNLISDAKDTVVERLLFSGWCVVLLANRQDVDRLQVEEAFHEDGEVPRTYGETIRTVSLSTPDVALRIERDMLLRTSQRWLDGRAFDWRG